MQLTAIILFIILSISHCSDSLKEPEQFPTHNTILTTKNKSLLNKADSLFFTDPKTKENCLTAIKIYSQINHLEAYWRLSRVYAYLAEISNSDEQSQYSEKGIYFAKQAITIDEKSAESYYYLALNMGHYADVNRLEGLNLLDKMEKAALKSIEVNPNLDQGGAYLFLGMLYYEAPGFTIGDTNKALKYLKKACDLFPKYPPNLLNFAIVLIKEDKTSIAINYLKQILAIRSVENENSNLSKWKKEAQKLINEQKS